MELCLLNQALAVVMQQIVPKQVNDKLLAQHKELERLRYEIAKIKKFSGCFVCSVCGIVDSEDEASLCTKCNRETCPDCRNEELSCQLCGRDLYCSKNCAEANTKVCPRCTEFNEIREQAKKIHTEFQAAKEAATKLIEGLREEFNLLRSKSLITDELVGEE